MIRLPLVILTMAAATEEVCSVVAVPKLLSFRIMLYPVMLMFCLALEMDYLWHVGLEITHDELNDTMLNPKVKDKFNCSELSLLLTGR